MRETYDWLERLARSPYADDDSNLAVPGAHASLLPLLLRGALVGLIIILIIGRTCEEYFGIFR